MSGSVTQLLDRLRDGDRAVVEPLWDRFFRRVVGLARARLGALPRGGADEEDVALSAFASVVRRAERGQLPKLADRHDLWAILSLVTARKALHLFEKETAARRDVRRTRASEPDHDPMLWLLSREPDPGFAAAMAEDCRRLLARLGDDDLRAIALAKLDGLTNAEIAASRQISLATVERRLALIRECWSPG